MRQVIGIFSEVERKMIAKRLRDGRKAKAATGRKSVGAYRYGQRGAGTGRERDAVPEANGQAAIARICELNAAGLSTRAIAARLDQEGHKPKRAESWGSSMVSVVLRRELASA